MAKNAKKRSGTLKIPNSILLAGKFLSFISLKFAMRFAARLFTTPIRHRLPKREIQMDAQSRQQRIAIPKISREINIYEYGEGDKKILLVHGWSGRGTQLVKIADALLAEGYSIISFDAPAHGKSSGKTTLMPEFIESILEIEKIHGPFEAAVGHSLGGMSLLNAMRKGFYVKKLVTIGSGDIIKDIMDDFIRALRLQPEISEMMRIFFERREGETMESYSSYIAAGKIDIPVLVIHDNDDADVPVKCGIHIHKHLKNGSLKITKGLGHRKILGDKEVINDIAEFIQH
ncbi:alpha/beta fold hydrolase [Flavobacterium pallidum]|uniref:Alpha/beta hydrolase n=1 Tax=Flavobacterium pallidum TaxID=2172098 RepID=A0A2S1SKI0_9FLAO|nr:alpha/beta hydrolase [Flavobacterium pallidum]AWI26889.1 alpha/beta hydrolase [Flavobacterium pallidum]